MVLGGAGFIGSNLVNLLCQNESNQILVYDNMSMGNKLGLKKRNVELIEADGTDTDRLAKAIRDFLPDRVYHLAANSDISAAAIDPSLDFKDTLGTTLSLIDALRGAPLQELIFASSSAVYGPVDGKIVESSPKQPQSAYGWMKFASEHFLEKAAKEGVFSRGLCVRFPNVTGQNQTHGVVHDLLRRLYSDRTRLNVLGDGTQDKPYVLAKDLVLIIEQLLAKDWYGWRAVNLAPKSSTTVREIVETIQRVTGLTPEITYGTSRSGWQGDVPQYSFDTALAEEILGTENIFKSSASAIEESVSGEWRELGGTVE